MLLPAFLRGTILEKIVLRAMAYVYRSPTRQFRIVKMNDSPMIAPINEDLGLRFWVTGAYEPQETAFLKDIIESTDVCIDVGGNVGYYSLLLSQLADQGSVEVFEPFPGNVSLIRASAALNARTNVNVTAAAVSDVVGQTTFSVATDSAYSSMLHTDRKPEVEQIDVPVITLDSHWKYLGCPKVKCLKIDVEGAEWHVIAGASEFLGDRQKRPDVVMIELFEKNMVPFGHTTNEVFQKLLDLGYQAFSLQGASGTPVPARIEDLDQTYNLVFLSDPVTEAKAK